MYYLSHGTQSGPAGALTPDQALIAPWRRPLTEHASPEVTAVETVGGVLTDLVEVAGMLPVPPGRARDVARILDRLAEEIGQAAGMLRAVSGTVSAAAGPAYNPWAVVRLVTRELAREGVRSGPARKRISARSAGTRPGCWRHLVSCRSSRPTTPPGSAPRSRRGAPCPLAGRASTAAFPRAAMSG
jgi:hypothetical protein